MTKADVVQAISTVTNARRSHQAFVDWNEAQAAAELRLAGIVLADTLGDTPWHVQCIKDYDQVLSVLSAYSASL